MDTLPTRFILAKKEHPDKILLFLTEHGATAYQEDAGVVAALLALTPTEEQRQGQEPWKSVWFPRKELETTLRALLKQGHKVAILEQVTAPERLDAETIGKMKKDIPKILRKQNKK